MIEDVPLTEPQRAALLYGRDNSGYLDGWMGVKNPDLIRRNLADKGLARFDKGWRWTTAGRRCVQWFADDCAEHWGVTVPTWNTYVRRGTAPQPDYAGTPRSTVDRAWWSPVRVRGFDRPGSQAGPESQRVRLDNAEVLRLWRARSREGLTVAKLAERFNVSTTTMSALLERMGEKPPTSASLRAGNGPAPQGARTGRVIL